MPTAKPTVFLDRDGTICEEIGYINHEDRFNLLPNTAAAIKLLNDNDIQTVVVTNQAGVAKGYFGEDLVIRIHKKLEDLLAQEGAHIDKIYYCPHHPDGENPKYRINCNCRKPKTGMIDMALKDLVIDLSHSYMVGDRIKDVYFGKKIGLKTVLVLTGYGKGEFTYHRNEWESQPDYIAHDLFDAICWILKDLGRIKQSHQ